MEITEQVKLTDLVKLSFFSLYFLPDVGVLCTSATVCVPRVASVISAERKSSSAVRPSTGASVEITSNDQPAQIRILYLSFRNHCAGLNFYVYLKCDTEFLPS